jgi:hypothetical protein
MISITDVGKDPDDECTLSVLGNFTLQGLVHLLATVANLAPSKRRAQLTASTMALLGMNGVPVGIGTSCGHKESEEIDRDDYQWKVPYLSLVDSKDLKLGKDLLVKKLVVAKDNSITLLLISGMTDAAALFRNHRELFVEKIREVVIMGGIERKDGAVVFDTDGDMIAESRAANNAFDFPAASYLYKELQVMHVPMWVLCKEAAYAAPVSRAVYDELALTGHPVGIRLKEMQCASVSHLWKRVHMASDDPRREKLPAPCDAAWFLKTFCGGIDKGLTASDEIWPEVVSFNMYDPLTLLVALPKYRHIYFDPHMVSVRGVEHGIVGLSAQAHGIKYPKAVASFIHSQMVEALDIYSQAMALAI